MYKRYCLLVGVSLYAQNLVIAQVGLRVEDPAPPLNVKTWINGPVVDSFAHDEIYVIEFWATWCKACIEIMPRLNIIAQKYRDDVRIIAVNIMEAPGTRVESTAKRMLKSLGNTTIYSAALDNDKFMEEHWFNAAYQSGIPSTFIVDKDRKIAWIGHPGDLDSVLNLMVNNRLDYKAAKNSTTFSPTSYHLSMPQSEAIFGKRREIHALLEKREWNQALADLVTLKRNDPETAYGLTDFRLIALANVQSEIAYKEITDLINSNDRWKLNTLFGIAKLDGFPKKFYLMARDAFEASINEIPALKGQPIPVIGLAEAYFHLGEREKAVATTQKLIDRFIDPGKVTEEFLRPYYERLEMFKTKKVIITE